MGESDDTPESVRLRIRREAGGLWGRLRSGAGRAWAGAGNSRLVAWYANGWASRNAPIR